ncbi:MAG: hypothetical protein QME96_18340, partial [Myxococcota bacterium]|nr:hypothetical protein [Myxococcota bacterium]
APVDGRTPVSAAAPAGGGPAAAAGGCVRMELAPPPLDVARCACVCPDPACHCRPQRDGSCVCTDEAYESCSCTCDGRPSVSLETVSAMSGQVPPPGGGASGERPGAGR